MGEPEAAGGGVEIPWVWVCVVVVELDALVCVVEGTTTGTTGAVC